MDIEKKIKYDLNVKLIEEVGKYECLYNVKCPQYKQLEHKERIWSEIGQQIGISVSESKKKWKYIRDGYNRNKQAIFAQRGFHKPYKYANFLKFLDNFTTDRHRRFITPVPADAEISTDLSSDYELQYEPSTKRRRQSLHNPLDGFGEYSSSVDESSRIESLGSNSNQVICVKNEDATMPEKNNYHEETTLYSEDSKEKDLSEKIIDEVKKYECIYDLQSSQYKNFPHKKRLWHKIGKRVGINGNDAKRRWKSLRDSYKKYTLKSLTEEGFVTQYKYAEDLRFLSNFCAFKPCTQRLKNVLSSTEISTDLSTDNELSTIQKPASSVRETANSTDITSRLFELLVNKINEANLTPQEKNDIEYIVSAAVYSKLAQYNKNKTDRS